MRGNASARRAGPGQKLSRRVRVSSTEASVIVRISAVLLSLWAGISAASDVGGELTLGGNKATADNPRTGYAGALVNGAWDINDRFGINGAFGYTHDNGTSNGTQSTSGSNILLFQLAGDVMLGEHFLLSAGAVFSPSTAGESATTITADFPRLAKTITVPAKINTDSSSIGALLMLAFATHGDSRWEHGIDFSSQLTRFGVSEQVVLDTNGLPLKERVTEAEVRSVCAMHLDAPACRVLTQPQSSSLFQARLALSYIATLFTDNDAALEFSYYLYDHDPTDTGFYSVATLGRTISLGETPNAIAPVQWALKPSFTHRFGERVSVKVWLQYGQYVPGQGYDTAAGAKIEVRLSHHMKVYLIGQGQRDIDAQKNVIGSGSGILGLTWTF